MNKGYYGVLLDRLLDDAMQVNRTADDKDVERNRVNYGAITAWQRVLYDMGHDVEALCYEDDGFLFISKIVADGETYFDFER